MNVIAYTRPDSLCHSIAGGVDRAIQPHAGGDPCRVRHRLQGNGHALSVRWPRRPSSSGRTPPHVAAQQGQNRNG